MSPSKSIYCNSRLCNNISMDEPPEKKGSVVEQKRIFQLDGEKNGICSQNAMGI